MLAVVTASSVWVQAPSATAVPKSAAAKRIARDLARDVLVIIASSPHPASVGNKAVGAAVAAARLDATRNAVDAIDGAEQVGLRIGCGRKPVVGPRQVLLRHCAD